MKFPIQKTIVLATLLIIGSCLCFLLASNAASVATFETEFLNGLKQKFKAFAAKTPEDRLYIQTDKTLYQPGETVWFTTYVRNATDLKPSASSEIIHVEFINPKGSIERQYKLVAKNGAAQGDLELSSLQPGGIYKVKAYTEWQKNDANPFFFEKEITVQNSVAPRLKMKLEFQRKAYGKGDEVIADLALNTNENKPLGLKQVKYKAMLDGKPLFENNITTDADGKTKITFKLPADLNTADGLLNVLIDYDGSTESISRSIPIVLNKIAVQFYPEGGDLVNGLATNVAFRAVNEFGKPADVEGFVFDENNKVVAQFASYHHGMGAFAFKPNGKAGYHAKLTKPEGINEVYTLPEVLPMGYGLTISKVQTNFLEATISSSVSEVVSVVAQTRGKIYFSGSLKARKGQNLLTINTKDFLIGVSQITLFDAKGIARCERMVFVHEDKKLKVSISTDKPQYLPREKVEMQLKVTDERGMPMPGNFSMAVVDDNQLSFADDKQGTILSKLLLEPELKEKVEEPNFYFDSKEPKAKQALDYLLMTSGWRRYTWKQVTDANAPPMTHQGELARIAGTVYENYGNNKPIADAEVVFIKQNVHVKTDKDGKFEFRNIDLAEGTELETRAKGFPTKNQTVVTYQTGINIYVNQMIYYNKMQMAGGGAMGIPMQANGGARMEMLMDEAAVDAKPMVAKAAFATKAAAKDWELKPDDVPLKPDVATTPMDEKLIAKERAGDLREAQLAQFDKKEGELLQPTFYRAKEFPKVVYKSTTPDSARNDYRTTVYWNGNVVTGRDGKAKVEFYNSDAVTSYKAVVEGFGDDGSIGHGEALYSTNLPLAMDAKIPIELVSGDAANIPVFLKNNTKESLTGKLEIEAPKCIQLMNGNAQEVSLQAGEAKTYFVNTVATDSIGDGVLSMRFVSSKAKDAINKKIKVIAKGFPANISLSGQALSKDFIIKPQNVVKGSMRVTLTAYPNIMTELLSGVESIIREPYGCFEQTSSSNYPNIMVLSYLHSMKVNNPELEARCTKLLDDGYKKLTAFETKENGYEWFGAAPAHEALTAYGLLEFEDMKKVYPKVDETMVNRTVQLLMNRKDGEGGFKKNPKAIDAFGGADEDVTNAYIVYALSEAGHKDIDKEFNKALQNAKASGDAYLLALMANACFNLKEGKSGDALLAQLMNAKNDEGSWTGKKHSITRSTGESLKIETTSLVVLAMLKSENRDVAALTKAVQFLVSKRSGYGGFGSTQATILSLKALTQYAEFSKRTEEGGTVEIYKDEQLIGSQNYAKGQQGNIVIGGLEKQIAEGTQKISVRFKGCKNALPYAVNVSYNTLVPASSADCAVRLQTTVAAHSAKVGETLRLTATLQNKTDKGQPMTIAIIGIPAGFTAQVWQLKELQDKHKVDFYELVGNNVVCYYRSLAPAETKTVNLDLKAEIPGTYLAPAASAYLYYTNELKDWQAMDKIVINP